METNSTFECGICFYQTLAKNFTPITVSANFAALECPKCLNNDANSFTEVCRIHDASMERMKKAPINFSRSKKEITIETNSTFECGICYYQSLAKDFTPISVSANFAALECPKCLNNDANSFAEIDVAFKEAA